MRELDETTIPDTESADSAEVLDEVEEMELASQLLEVTSDAELDQFIGDLVGRATHSLRQFAGSGAGRALRATLKQTAKRALPFVGRTVGGYIGGPAGARAGAQAATAAGRLFGLELEGLSPEDQEFETARRFVRFGRSAARQTARAASRRTRPRAAARVGLRRAARRLAPGLRVPAPAAAPDATASDTSTPSADAASPATTTSTVVRGGGRWNPPRPAHHRRQLFAVSSTL